MTEKQEKFLRLSVIEGMYYSDIEKELDVSRSVLTQWWDELKLERLRLTKIKNIWKAKAIEMTFDEFSNWYNKTKKKCHYCGLTDSEMKALWKKYPLLTKRTRGRVLEIDRKQPNGSYNEIYNLVFACYWCNNAKTDTFSEEEFKEIGKVIRTIWNSRLQ